MELINKVHLSEWAEDYNINQATLWTRLYELNWSIEKSLLTPVKNRIKI